ncbi:MAG: Ada metal-binding domain-containing protein [Armatimonas sp.]
MTLTPDDCYQALVAHDARFDGVFFVGVSTTGIYCRPVCRAKTPRRSSCTFYANAAAAEEAGFRPCLRCRPELAPGRARCDAMDTLARRAASRIEDGALNEQSVAELAQSMGSSERHLRRSVEKTFGVSPVALAQTHRLLLAKRLLTDTDLPITEIAFASGFTPACVGSTRFLWSAIGLTRLPCAAAWEPHILPLWSACCLLVPHWKVPPCCAF